MRITTPLFAFVVVAAVSGCTDPRHELAALATASDCEVDSDCCIAVEGCSATAYPVDRDQADEAISLVDKANDGFCVDCIAPRGIPRCDDGRCALILLDLDEEGPALDDVGDGVSCLPPGTEPVVSDAPGRQAIGCDSVDDE